MISISTYRRNQLKTRNQLRTLLIGRAGTSGEGCLALLKANQIPEFAAVERMHSWQCKELGKGREEISETENKQWRKSEFKYRWQGVLSEDFGPPGIRTSQVCYHILGTVLKAGSKFMLTLLFFQELIFYLFLTCPHSLKSLCALGGL